MVMMLVALSLSPFLILFLYRYPMLLLHLFSVFQLVDVFYGFYPLRVGRFHLLPMDSVYFVAMAYLGIFVLRYPRKFTAVLRENLFLTVFLALVALYVLIYTPIYGQSSIGEARKLYGFFIFPLLALIVIKRPEDLHRFVQVVILTAAVVAIVALGNAAGRGSIVRVVNAQGTLMIALAAFAMLVHRFQGVVVFHPTMDRILLFLFAVLAIGSGQRSVWLAIGFGLALVLWFYRSRPMFMIKIAVVATALLMAFGTALVFLPETGARLAKQFAGILDPYSDETASWRIEAWRQQMAELREANLMFGEGLGSYYSWESQGHTVTYSPHNAYVQIALKFGLLGLIVYGLLVFQFLRRTMEARKKLGPSRMRAYIETGIINVGAVHAYMLGYEFHLAPLIFFALAITAAKLSEGRFEKLRVSRKALMSIGARGIPATIRHHRIHRVGSQSSPG